jgi:hypothetical protein
MEATYTELAAFVIRMKDARAAGSGLLDVLAPNGKRVRDLTGPEVEEIGKAIGELGVKLGDGMIAVPWPEGGPTKVLNEDEVQALMF